MVNNGILIFFHCKSNTGYAIESLEKVFFEMAFNCFRDYKKIHFAYTSLEQGSPKSLPENFSNIIEFDSSNSEDRSLHFIYNYIRKNKITIAFGFDQPVSRPAFKVMRRAGIKKLISYWGAPMSSLNNGLILSLKKLQVFLNIYKPDHYIFESLSMAKSAINGRGIGKKNVSVIRLGVDTEKFKPSDNMSYYAHKVFRIPTNRKIVFYSGHMEERKGVKIIIKAATELINKRNRDDVHFLLVGNKYSEEEIFSPIYKKTKAASYITFGGYRDDIDKIIPSCYVGTIASTGWDSFTMSSIEMAACGLPLIVSNLQGLVESVENNATGFIFENGNFLELADRIGNLLDSPEMRKKMSIISRNRVLSEFSVKKQIYHLTRLIVSLNPALSYGDAHH